MPVPEKFLASATLLPGDANPDRIIFKRDYSMSAIRFRVLPSNYEKTQVNKQRGQWNKALLVTLFLLPGMAIFFLFLLMPISQSFYFSQYKWNGLGPISDFVGMDNFANLLKNATFQNSLLHSVILMALSLSIQLPLALGLALLVGRGHLRGRRFFRGILFIPFVFSEIITAIIWLYVFKPVDGLANAFLVSIIPGFQPISWLGERDIVLFSIFAIITWKYFGFHMILY
ncbi:MAG: sugar ABC transporter permease, partial [Anaerolineae bacterium]|nr:sugar ABC transporter permease [Anaerolineae bacterium]